MTSRASWFLAGLLFMAPAGIARADAIPSAPACPAGAHGVTSHAGQWCEVASCSQPCASGESCRDWRVCTSMMTVPGGRTYGGEHPAFEQEEVVASCAQSESCDGANTSAWPPTRGAPHDGVRCHVQPVCVPDASVTTSSSMCSVGHGGDGHASLALLAIGLVARAARRRVRA